MCRSLHAPLPAAGLLALVCLASVSEAQDQTPPEPLSAPDVTVILQGKQRPPLRLAFPATQGIGGLPSALAAGARVLERTLRADLDFSRIFDLRGPEQLAVLRLTGEQQRDFEIYRSLQNEILLLTEVKSEAEKLVLEGRLYDLKSGLPIFGKRYRGTPRVVRRIAHTFADEIILYFSARPGIALTSIAFTSDRSGFKEIYLMDYDGENQRPITAHKSISLFPGWSPTGDAIAYVSYFTRAPGIYLVDLATGRKRTVINEGSLNISPSFSPEGRRIVFARSVGGGNSEIFIGNRDGSDLRRLTHASSIDTTPSWSPSGREIAFTSSRSGSPQIYIMDAEGANLRRISLEGDYNDGASWDPEGTRLVYASRRSGRFQIVVSDVVTLESRLLTSGQGSNESPSFSPDGRKIVFASKGGYGARSGRQLVVMDADGRNPHLLTREGNNSSPAWSGYRD